MLIGWNPGIYGCFIVTGLNYDTSVSLSTHSFYCRLLQMVEVCGKEITVLIPNASCLCVQLLAKLARKINVFLCTPKSKKNGMVHAQDLCLC